MPERQGEHPPEFPDGIEPELLIRVDYHFCVRLSGEFVTLPDKIVPDLDEVVDFPVVDALNAPILILHWLMAALQVDDAQSADTKGTLAVFVIADIVGTSM